MRNYEIAFLLKEGEELKPTIETIKELFNKVGGEITDEFDMGNRHLAYSIFKNRETINKAFYYFIHLKLDNTMIAEFERVIKINDNVIRHMIVNME